MTIDFDDQVAIVTGAGARPRAELCARPGARGAKVVIADLGPQAEATAGGDTLRRRHRAGARGRRDRLRRGRTHGRAHPLRMGPRRHRHQQCRHPARQELRQDGTGRLPGGDRRPPDGIGPRLQGRLAGDARAEIRAHTPHRLVVRHVRHLRPVQLRRRQSRHAGIDERAASGRARLTASASTRSRRVPPPG